MCKVKITEPSGREYDWERHINFERDIVICERFVHFERNVFVLREMYSLWEKCVHLWEMRLLWERHIHFERDTFTLREIGSFVKESFTSREMRSFWERYVHFGRGDDIYIYFIVHLWTLSRQLLVSVGVQWGPGWRNFPAFGKVNHPFLCIFHHSRPLFFLVTATRQGTEDSHLYQVSIMCLALWQLYHPDNPI